MKLNLHPKGIPKLEPLGTGTPLKKGGVVVGERRAIKKKSILSVMTATCSVSARHVQESQDVWFLRAFACWDLPENPYFAPIPKQNCSTTPLIS